MGRVRRSIFDADPTDLAPPSHCPQDRAEHDGAMPHPHTAHTQPLHEIDDSRLTLHIHSLILRQNHSHSGAFDRCTGSGEYTAASAARACEHSAVGPALSERRRRRVGGAVGPPLAPRGVVWREAYVQPFVATWGVTGCLRDLFDRGSVRFVRGSVAGGSVDPGFELRLRAELPLEFRS